VDEVQSRHAVASVFGLAAFLVRNPYHLTLERDLPKINPRIDAFLPIFLLLTYLFLVFVADTTNFTVCYIAVVNRVAQYPYYGIARPLIKPDLLVLDTAFFGLISAW
jgi:hypothetical protein